MTDTHNPDRRASQLEQLSALQEQMSFLREATNENSRSLRGAENYIGLIPQVMLLSNNVDTLMTSIGEIRDTLKIIEARKPCESCDIDGVKRKVATLEQNKNDFPNILWLLRYKTKETVPLLIFVIVTVSMIGHLQIEPLLVILMSGVGISPAIIAAILKVFGK